MMFLLLDVIFMTSKSRRRYDVSKFSDDDSISFDVKVAIVATVKARF